MGPKESKPFLLHLMMETDPDSETLCFQEGPNDKQCPEKRPQLQITTF
jgi:hypothetical protein